MLLKFCCIFVFKKHFYFEELIKILIFLGIGRQYPFPMGRMGFMQHALSVPRPWKGRSAMLSSFSKTIATNVMLNCISSSSIRCKIINFFNIIIISYKIYCNLVFLKINVNEL